MRSQSHLLSVPFQVLATSLLCIATATWSTAADSKPNILIIVGDDMGYSDVGMHGCKDIPTPHLDALSKSGTRFTNGYVSGPYCSPTRAGLLTGRYQTRFGHEFNPGGNDSGLPTNQSTLADRLKSAGYATGLVGKWHLGSKPDMIPNKRGFDEFFGFLGGAHSYFEKQGILRNQTPVQELDYTTDAFGREACDFISRHQGKPWFLYLAFNAVHTPMDATEERLSKFANIEDKKRRTYAAMMSAMDDAIGKVRATLEATGQADNTLIAFISDNGGPTMKGTTENGSVNLPLRGSKRTTLEGGVRVPFILAWPKHVPVGVYEQPVIQLDLHATALAASGVKADESWKLDGVDLVPYVSGKNTQAPHDALYWRFGKQTAIRQGDWKLVRYDANADTNSGAGGQGVTSAKLYNLASDIGESKDLSAAMPDKVKELDTKWNAWNAGNVDPLWGGEAKAGGNAGGKKKAANAKKTAADE